MTSNSRTLRTLGLVGLALLSSAADSHAQFNSFITGQVVDPQGVGVAGVDIDVDNLRGGGDPGLLNDGTDAGGFFTTTVEETGTFTFTFRPPPPPTTSLLLTSIPGVSVSTGTNNIGVISLAQGVDVQGSCVGPTGLPAGNVNFDIYDASGTRIKVAGAFTSLFGTFRFAAPPGPVEMRMDTVGVISETLAPTIINPTFAGTSMNLGSLVLPRGYHVMATLLQPNGLPLGLTDTDVVDSATGELLWTPNDNSSVAGLVDLIVPAGTFDIIICPAVATGLAATGARNVTVFTSFNAGSFMLEAGALLSGVVRDDQNQPMQGVNIDIEDSLGDDIFLCGDNTAIGGTYALIVPTGTWRLEYKPSYALPLGAGIQDDFVLTGNTVNNVSLPSCPTHVPYGPKLAGTGGLFPALSASGGSARLGNPDYTLEITKGLGKGKAHIVSGFAAATTPFHGGILLVGGPIPPSMQAMGKPVSGPGGIVGPIGPPSALSQVLGMKTVRLGGVRGGAGTGSLSYSEPIPSDPFLVGFTRYVQVLIEDEGGLDGFALTNGIRIDYCE